MESRDISGENYVADNAQFTYRTITTNLLMATITVPSNIRVVRMNTQNYRYTLKKRSIDSSEFH